MDEFDYIDREQRAATAEEIRRWEALDIGRGVPSAWRSCHEGDFDNPDERTISQMRAKHLRSAWNAAAGRADIEQDK